MERRNFLALSAAPLAGHVSRVLTMPPRAGRRHRPRRQFAVLILVIPPANWRPKNWRDIPPASSTAPFTVIDRYEASAVGICRSVAKLHNVNQLRDGVRTWAIVACNDGRFHRQDGGAL